VKIKLLKLVDKVAGTFVAACLPVAHSGRTATVPNRILIIRPGGIGDAALLFPALGALKKKFPQARVTVLAEKRNAGIFSLNPSVDQVLRYDVASEFLAVFRLKPDIVIDTEQFHRLSAVVARLTGAVTLIGFASNERSCLFHHAIPYSHDDYEANSFFHLFFPLGISDPATIAEPFLSVPVTAQFRANKLLAPLAGHPFIALFSGASVPERRWGGARFSQVAVRLTQQGYKIVVVGGKEDVTTGATVIQEAGGLNLAGCTTLAETAAILEQASLLISADSGVLHLGVGLGIPTVSLFGPGIAKKWAPRGPQHIVLNKQLSCSPCTQFGYTNRCPRQAACLQHITPELVIDAVFSLLRT